MCGIAGLLNLEPGPIPSRKLLQSMADKLRHRGPDGTGFYSDQHIGLAHTRLSIIDLATGGQPIHNEDKTVWVIFNGEIFNYIELRAELEKTGHRFYTQSDTEVLVHLYEEYGPAFVDYLNGQFAIALWDIPNRTLYLTRDRPGILPLFYTQQSGQLIFASEIKAILPALDSAPQLNRRALDQLMTFWAPVSPETVFQGIFEVSPGEIITIRDKRLNRNKYWDWTYPNDGDYRTESESQLAEELHSLLIDATQIRLRSDVPVGAYLSGGLDSSVLTSIIHHHGGVPLRTFSIGFEDRSLDETAFQEKLIEHLHADHSSIYCKYSDIGEDFIHTIWHTESPVLRTAPVPMKMLSGLVRNQNYKVVLTGEGSDEALGGYDIFKEAKIRWFWSRHPQSKLRPILLKRLYPYLDVSPGKAQRYLQIFFGEALDQPDLPYFSHIPRWSTTAKCKDLFSDTMKEHVSDDPIETILNTLPQTFMKWHPFNRSQYIEAKSLMAGYLLSSQGDRMLMSNSIEGRFPYLDHRVIEFANRIPPKLKMKVLNEKYILKRATGHYLPARIVKRDKQPYRAPDIPAFFSGSLPEYAEELLSSRKIQDYGYFNDKKVLLLIKKIQKGRAIGNRDNMALVGILSTQLWHHHFIECYVKNFKNDSIA